MRQAHGWRAAAGVMMMLVSTAAWGEEPSWGPEVGGLRAGVTVQPAEARLGEEFVIRISIRNVSDRPTHVRFQTVFRALACDIRNEKGEPVRCVQGSVRYDMPMPKEFYHHLKPGETYETTVKGRARYEFVPAAKRPVEDADRALRIDFHDVITDKLSPGKYTVALRLVVDAKKAEEGRVLGIDPVWTGELASKAAAFSFRAMTRQELDANAARIGAGTYEERRAAIAVAAANADRGSVKALMALLAEGEGPLREAADALVAVQDTSVVPELLRLYQQALRAPKRDPGPWPAALIGAIRQLEPEHAKVVAFVVDVLKSDAPVEARSTAMWSLWNERSPEFVAAVLELAKRREPRMQWAAIDVLGTLGGNLPRAEKGQVSGPLVEILKTDPEATVRSRAAGVLRTVGDPAVAPALVAALNDADLFVGLSAVISLGTLGRLEDIPALEAWARDKPADRQKTAEDSIRSIRQLARRPAE